MPQAIGLALLELIAPTLVGTSIIPGLSLATVVGSVVVAAVLVGVKILTAKPAPKQEDGSIPIRQASPPRQGGYGRGRPRGYYMCYEQRNGTSADVIAFASGRVGGYVQHYLHDDAVTLDGSGFVQALAEGQYGGNNVRILTRLGEPTETAFAEVVDLLGSDGTWTDSHRGDGIAGLALIAKSVKATQHQKIYPNNLPMPSPVMDMFRVWDFRDPAQSRTDPSTWATSRNPFVNALDYMTQPNRGGPLLDYETRFAPVLALWIKAANQCDDLVAKVGGTQKRYECGGWYTFDTKNDEVVGEMMAACDGWLAEGLDGTMIPVCGVYEEPTRDILTIRPKHLKGGYRVRRGVPVEERINEIIPSFTSPPHKYAVVQALPLTNDADIARVGRKPRAITFAWCQDFPQLRRLTKRSIDRFSAEMSGELRLSLFGLALMTRRWIKVQLPNVAGLADAVIENQGIKIDLLRGRCVLQFIKVDPAKIEGYNPATDEGEPPPVVAKGSRGDLPVLTDFRAEALGSPPFRITASWDTIVSRTDLGYVLRYRLAGDPDAPYTDVEFQALEDVGGRTSATVYPTTTAMYELQGATIGPGGTYGTFTTPPVFVLTDPAALYDNAGILLVDNAGNFIADNS